MIVAEPESPDQPVCGAAMTPSEARITIVGVPDVPGTSLEIFSRLADRKVTVDMIVQNVGEEGKSDISFTVPSNELDVALQAVEEAAEVGGSQRGQPRRPRRQGLRRGAWDGQQTGVANRMFAALAAEEINIQMITTSEIKISALVDRDAALPALRAVHQTFELGSRARTVHITRPVAVRRSPHARQRPGRDRCRRASAGGRYGRTGARATSRWTNPSRW